MNDDQFHRIENVIGEMNFGVIANGESWRGMTALAEERYRTLQARQMHPARKLRSQVEVMMQCYLIEVMPALLGEAVAAMVAESDDDAPRDFADWMARRYGIPAK